MPVVEARIPENPEIISALVQKLPGYAPNRSFSQDSPNLLRVKAVQERLFTPTDLTG